MSPWLLICLHLPALIFMLWLMLNLGLLIEDWLSKIKRNLLQQHGLETEGVMLESEDYTGPGLHSYDPCFKGRYQFTDHRGKIRQRSFKNHCYDQYDYDFYALRDAYRPGASLKVRYLRAFPLIHYMNIRYRPDKKESELPS